MNYSWGTNRRFNAYSDHFKRSFGSRLQKVTIDAGFTCPNRDGTKGTGGCAFCNNDAFNPSYCTPDKSITQQIEEGIEFHTKRYRKADFYLAYFQAYTNSYASLDTLKKLYEEALSYPNIKGIIIGTRPDCINTDILRYLKELSEKYYIHIEVGVESVYDSTLSSINRCHDYKTAKEAIEEIDYFGITVGAHFILGLPGETPKMLLKSVDEINSLPITTLKFHQLQILKGTLFEELYKKAPWSFLFWGLDDYIDFVIDLLERLNPNFIIERIAGEVPPKYQSTAGWGLIRNEQIVARLDKRLEERGTYQGRLYAGK